MLNELEIEILKDIYEMCINNGPTPNINKYNLIEKDSQDKYAKVREVASYLIKLRTLGYVEFDDKQTFSKGGIRNQKYKNNVLGISFEKIIITEKGIELIKKEQETIKDKVVSEVKDVGVTLYKRLIDGLIGFIVGGIVIGWLTRFF